MLDRLMLLLVLLLPLSTATHATDIDELALRHYAARQQRDRVALEIARLGALDPKWVPPDDLWTSELASADEDELWDVLDMRGSGAAQAALAERQRTDPAFRASAALLLTLRRKSGRAAMFAAAEPGRSEAIAAVFDRDPGVIDPGDIEARWVVAEALSDLGRRAEATEMFRALLLDPAIGDQERRASLQKAIMCLGMFRIEPMVETLAADPLRFAPLVTDVARARIAARLREEKVAAPDEAAMLALGAATRASDKAGDAALLAWWARARNDHAGALGWFRLAMEREPGAITAHGLAHTLRDLGQLREAEDMAFSWRDALVNNAILFVDLLEVELTRPNPHPLEPERLRRYARVTLDTASGEGAQALGWYALNTCQYEAALAWFERAVAWFPKEQSVVGLAIALGRMGKRRDMIELVNRVDGLFPTVVALMWGGAETTAPPACEAPRATPAPVPRRAPPRAEFPVGVDPENHLRHASAHDRPLARVERERVAGTSTTARRVRGVGAMPYEDYGYQLLPAYDGHDIPDDRGDRASRAPVGTLWAREMARRDRGQHDLPGGIRPAASAVRMEGRR